MVLQSTEVGGSANIKADNPDLPSNRNMCMAQLRTMLKRLNTMGELSQYNDIIQEQLKRNFIEVVPNESDSRGIVHYLYHIPVVRASSSTSRLRIVYNASAKMNKSSPSLNDCLFTGDLFEILLNFRLHRVGLLADIEKAFLMVGLKPSDRDCTRFLWVKDIHQPLSDENLVIFRFLVVLFGIVCSPFLLNATVKHHLTQYSNWVASDMQNKFYVDKLVTSVMDSDVAMDYYSVAKTIMNEAKMNLHEWKSNDPQVIAQIPANDCVAGNDTKVLGLNWNTKEDVLSLKSILQPSVEILEAPTKRFVLHFISLVYDPLGLVTPIMYFAKILMQDIWKSKIAWNDKIPENTMITWKKLFTEILKISDLRIPRWCGATSFANLELHAFGDASKRAYACVVYMRWLEFGIWKTTFLCSKNKVGPVVELTLPRMELQATHLASEVVRAVRLKLEKKVMRLVLWTDSQIVLWWLSGEKPLKQYVNNRVKNIKAVTEEFRYCPTKLNPADIPSRGCKVEELAENNLWWNGPEFLCLNETDWPEQPIPVQPPIDSCLLETQKCVHIDVVADESGPTSPFELQAHNFCKLTKLLRVTAWTLRFVNRLRKKTDQTGSLTAGEIQNAKELWDRFVQAETFPEELKGLRQGRVSNTGLEGQLGLYLNDQDIICCKGRLGNAEISLFAAYPKLLPKNHAYTNLVVLHKHKMILHQGVKHTLTNIRQEYWIPCGRQLVKKLLNRCVICKKWCGKGFQVPEAAPLPEMRLKDGVPFHYTGTDFCGPLYVRREKNMSDKCYICIFTCAVTRAIHLEIVEDLTTQTFLLALRRFIACRGQPKLICSDNAKTYKLAVKTLEEMWVEVVLDEELHDYISGEGIEWKFNVARASWYGGIFERLIGSVKNTLKKVIGKSILTFRELETQIAEIGAILNSRPMTYVHSDVNDGMPLTPNHFLCINQVIGLPHHKENQDDPDFNPSPTTATQMIGRIKARNSMLEEFWKSWKADYLTNLREHHCNRGHGSQNETKVELGDVVIIKDTTPRAKWRLGIIEKLIKSHDDRVRAAIVRVGRNTRMDRSLAQLVPLEINSRGE